MPLQAYGTLLRIRNAVADAMESLGKMSEGDIKQDLSTPFPPASAPGTEPHLRTGNLQEHVSHQTSSQTTMEVSLAMISERAPDGNSQDADVPVALEFGTPRMEPRPYMAPAFQRDRERVLPYMAAQLKANVKP